METVELEFYKKQINSNINRALANNIVITNFIDEAKQAIIMTLNKGTVDVIFDGGFINSERKRCIFKPYDLEVTNFKISVYQIIYNKRYLTINHRNILGSLLSLGIKRDSIGDIVIKDDEAYFACTEEIAQYIENSFKMIGKHSIELKKIVTQIDASKELVLKKYIVSSMRIDVIIAAVYGFSRNEANEYISSGLVNINHFECLNSAKMVKVEDLISVRHKGRIYVKEIGGKTKSDRLVLTLGFLE